MAPNPPGNPALKVNTDLVRRAGVRVRSVAEGMKARQHYLDLYGCTWLAGLQFGTKMQQLQEAEQQAAGRIHDETDGYGHALVEVSEMYQVTEGQSAAMLETVRVL